MTVEQFADALGEAMLTLPQDLKALLRLVEDPELDEAGRTLACGAMLHVLSGANAIPGVKGTLAYADDVLVLRLTVERLEESSPDVVARHREDLPEVYDAMDEQMEIVRDYLGDLLSVLDRATDGLPKLTYEGHSAELCSSDEDASTWLYDSVHEAIVERLELRELDVARAVKGAGEIKTYLKQRV